ncbi:MAG TPA: hypothetical protein VGJ05_15685 [Fimbriiglobus sp.]|jgi:hypothetical protein
MNRRTTLLLLFALATLPGAGCYHLRNCVANFRANHPCLFPCAGACGYSAYPAGVGCGAACGCPAEGCASSSYSNPGIGQPYPAAMFGMPQPLPNAPTVDQKGGLPNPMK